MMTNKIWVVADWHLGHDKSLTWLNEQGLQYRPFPDIDTYHKELIQRHNALVQPEDKVYVLGDAAIKKPALSLVREFVGKKTLVLGNHDIFDTKDYLTAGFKNCRGVRVLPEFDCVLSHIPIHKDSLYIRKTEFINVHGHLHDNRVRCSGIIDARYICVSVDQTNFAPVNLEETLKNGSVC
jgi:calcineurin-like phosphoesterase family protein